MTKLQPTHWWQFGYVWLLIAGPACVIIAGFFTIYLAYAQQDPVLDQDYYQQGLKINQTPAMKARNLGASHGAARSTTHP